MDAFVVDVSACMPGCCEDEATAVSERLLQRAADRHPLHVPSLWPWEMMNALAVCRAAAADHSGEGSELS